MSERTADLHLHTHYSDGTETPARVIALAKQAGLSTVAITDHDTTEGLPEAYEAGKAAGVEVLPGIEMSASTDGLEVHLLGLLIDVKNYALVEHLVEQRDRRVQRVHAMVERLERVGARISADEVLTLAGKGTVGRPHVARVLLKHGYISSLPEAFEKYIGPSNAGFVPGSPVPPADIIRLIRGAGGVPVLAHPIFLKNDALIETFMSQGLAGVEAFHSSHNPEQVRHYEQLADRLGLLKTGGSDFHGDSKEGVAVGAVKVPYALVEALRRWKTASV
jgi:predicted metal-dependent phosphoesterase TrpH